MTGAASSGPGWAALLLLLGACRVPQHDIRVDALLPNLLRASEALQDRIAREREHVQVLNLRLDALRQDEARVYASFLEGEADYQKRQADLAGVQEDTRQAEAEMDVWRARLEDAQEELKALREQLVALRQELQGVQAALEAGWARLGMLLGSARDGSS